MSGNIRQITSDNINENSSQRGYENNYALDRGHSRNRQIPASREEWAEVLATADKYY